MEGYQTVLWWKDEQISYFKDDSTLVSVPREKIWGYCKRGNPYVKDNRNFYRMAIIGALIHYTAASQDKFNLIIDPTNQGTSLGKRKQRMYPKIIDFKTGIRSGYSLQSLTYFIKKDTQLHAAFLNEPKRIEMMFIYLMKYNYRNPIYFQNQQR